MVPSFGLGGRATVCAEAPGMAINSSKNDSREVTRVPEQKHDTEELMDGDVPHPGQAAWNSIGQHLRARSTLRISP